MFGSNSLRLAHPFTAGTFNPKEKVTLNGQNIMLAQCASRMNVKLLRPAVFNSKLRERGVDKKVTVQKVCRNEKDVRLVLDEIWKELKKAKDILDETLNRNQGIFNFKKEISQ